jgi:hypothetical protein
MWVQPSPLCRLRAPRTAVKLKGVGAFPWRAIRSQIEPPCAGMLMPKLQTQVSPRLTYLAIWHQSRSIGDEMRSSLLISLHAPPGVERTMRMITYWELSDDALAAWRALRQ